MLTTPGCDSAVRDAARQLALPVIDVYPHATTAGRFSIRTPNPGVSILQPSDVSLAEPDDCAFIIFTSGTTSRSKAVMWSQRELCLAASHAIEAHHLGPTDRALNIMPMFHITGLLTMLVSPLVSGGTVICPPGFRPDHFFDWLVATQPTWYHGVPTMHRALLGYAPQHQAALHHHTLRFIRSSSSALTEDLLRRLETTFNVPVIQIYGMSELFLIASNPLPPKERKIGSVGLPVYAEFAILDDAGLMLPPHQHGEIRVRNHRVVSSYEDGDVEPDAPWFHTGDLGYIDDDGYIFLTGRTKDLINRGGEKITPGEVEAVLKQHPAVEDAVVFPVPHPTLGEDVAAAVTLRDSMTIHPQTLRDFAAGALAHFKLPSTIVVVDEIPRSTIGKIQRALLAQLLGLTAEPMPTNHDYAAPRTPLEAQVAALWQDVLGRDTIGIHDPFYALGGDSLLAAQIVGRIRETLAVDVRLADFMNAYTIADMALIVLERQAADLSDEQLEQLLNDLDTPELI